MGKQGVLLGMLGLLALAWAQPLVAGVPPLDCARFPSACALADTPRLPADRVALATQFLGYHANSDAPQPPAALGDVRVFNVSNREGLVRVTARAQAVGAQVVLWVQEGVTVRDAPAFVQALDALLQQVQALWGMATDALACVGDGRVHVLLTTATNPNVAGYFSSQHLYPRGVFPTSSELALLVFNAAVLGDKLDSVEARRVAAHELQHLLRYLHTPHTPTWLNEGFSLYTENALGLGEGSDWLVRAFLDAPDAPLTIWRGDLPKPPQYGASALFLRYLAAQAGAGALHTLRDQAAHGMAGVTEALIAAGYPLNADDFFADWVAANALDTGYPAPLRYGVRVQAAASDYPFTLARAALPYSTHYLRLDGLGERDTLQLTLELPDAVPLLPDDTPDGARFAFSSSGSSTQAWFVRAFDLRAVRTAELRFWAWYDLEEGWDYAYLAASVDGGATWTTLPTTSSRDDNPQGRAYGVGWTGASSGWLAQRASLDAYVGRELLLAFVVITDEAVAHAGFALDAVTLDALGYRADFEGDDGGWQALGWAVVDNRLPPRGWLQVLQLRGEVTQTARFFAAGGIQTFSVPLLSDAAHTLLAFSPLTPFSQQPIAYTLRVEALTQP